jgi:hypothetical protein
MEKKKIVSTSVDIGKLSYSGKLKNLTFTNFKKYWEGGKNEKRTGLNAEKAAEKFGIKK